MSYRARNDARRARAHGRRQEMLQRCQLVLRQMYPQPDVAAIYARQSYLDAFWQPRSA